MISGTVVELCAVVSELAAERDVYRRKADRIGEQMAELEELRAKVASRESMLDHQTNELNQSIERTATALAEVTRLRAELDALKAGKSSARVRCDCGGPMDTWCERCDVGDAGELADSPQPFGHEQAGALWTELHMFDMLLSWYDVSNAAQLDFIRIVGKHAGIKISEHVSEAAP